MTGRFNMRIVTHGRCRRSSPVPQRSQFGGYMSEQSIRRQISGHVFIVTGASSGIGLSTATALAQRGANVALLARSSEALAVLAQRLPGSLPITVDMTRFGEVHEAVRRVHRHYGRVDGLINNAGRSYAAAIEEIDPALFDEIFHLNVLG